MVRRPFRRFRSGWEALRVVRECLEGTFNGTGVARKPSRWSVSGREVFPKFREWSGGPP